MQITYNSHTETDIIDKVQISENHETFSVSANILVKGSSESNLISKCKILEEKYSEINKDLQVKFGVANGSTDFDFGHSANSGFLSRPSITKIQRPETTGFSRVYNFSCSVQLPFDQNAYKNRRDASYIFTFDTSRRRTAVFNVVYTASDERNLSATETYNHAEGARAWALSVLTTQGGDFELIKENFNVEHENKILNGTLVYREILVRQSETVSNVEAIVDPQINYAINYKKNKALATGYTAIPQTEIFINFSMFIDYTKVSGDITSREYEIKQFYYTTVRDWFITNSYSIVGADNSPYTGQNFYVMNERINFDVHNFKISGSIVVIIPPATDSILFAEERLIRNVDKNLNLEPIFDGQDYTYNAYSWGGVKTLTRMVTVQQVGSAPQKPSIYNGNNVVGMSREGDESGCVWQFLNSRETRNAEDFSINPDGSGSILSDTLYTLAFMDFYILWRPKENKIIENPFESIPKESGVIVTQAKTDQVGYNGTERIPGGAGGVATTTYKMNTSINTAILSAAPGAKGYVLLGNNAGIVDTTTQKFYTSFK